MRIIALATAILLACSSPVDADPQTAHKAGQKVEEGFKETKRGVAKGSKKVARKSKKGYKHARRNTKRGFKNTRSDVNTGVDAAQENRENR